VLSEKTRPAALQLIKQNSHVRIALNRSFMAYKNLLVRQCAFFSSWVSYQEGATDPEERKQLAA
jgi:hypothetical protein